MARHDPTHFIATKGTNMKSRLIRTMLGAACWVAPLAGLGAAPAAAQSVVRPAQDISLSIGNGQLVNVPGSMADVFVANDQVADVQVKSANQFYVFGKSGGTTTVYASNGTGTVIWSANVRVGSNLDSVDTMLRLAMPDAQIGVSTMGTNTFLLTGTVKAPEDAAEAERLVQAYVGEKANVISRLRMATPLQVNLQVRFAEVSRTLVREIGSNLVTRDLTGGFTFGLSRGRGAGTIGAIDTSKLPMLDASSLYGLPAKSLSLPFDPQTGKFITGGTSYAFNPLKDATTLGLAGKIAGVDLLSALDLAETVGLVTTLAQPNLTALSGETAEFLAGGEYPIPISQGLGTTAIEYKKYGVSLSYAPTVLANGRISLRVRPEVSELSSEGAVTLNGFQVPALTIRRAETTIELGSGQSFMIAGLMSNKSQNTIDKTPGAGDLPILGSLFRSTSYRKGETELVIVVTPYLVNPVNASDIKLPTDGFKAPNELQRLLGNMESDGVSGPRGDRPAPSAAPAQTPSPAPGLGDAGDSGKAKKKGKAARQAEAADAAPGFNLK
ncbi:type II and III secretion system protein family protein [Novosphingobium album (ex Liu et al. 2023)]|uniref:Type II and III secretion system protein family protein n=1 Tax=Novosphingobium album (ex Liu et al. 2023) TaxID=3031130 RepID=A0ABT5WRE4_9SPHN|nr:type II and III secretion system protein family protein [Novosphingobium album (ex Liu et al. 2023)]MDE8652609.1 type II and III secretion system protein family protein [Novosphingobium album (ex Liu et al. 2023)]